MYAFEEESIWSKVAEIGTWVLLFIFLVPGTALGFFAENSLPNSPLYPVKRGIETVMLTLVSYNQEAKSAYELSLANTRFSETKKLLASNSPLTQQDFQQFNNVTTQLDAAQSSINAMSNSIQKAQLQAQFKTTITSYQSQLTQMQQQLQNSSTGNQTGQPSQQPDQPFPTSTQTPPVQTSSQAQPDQSGQNIATPPSQPTPADAAAINTQNLSPEQQQELSDQIQQFQDQLTNLEHNFQQGDSQKNPLNQDNQQNHHRDN